MEQQQGKGQVGEDGCHHTEKWRKAIIEKRER